MWALREGKGIHDDTVDSPQRCGFHLFVANGCSPCEKLDHFRLKMWELRSHGISEKPGLLHSYPPTVDQSGLCATYALCSGGCVSL